MRKNTELDRLDRDSCQMVYRNLCDSLFDTNKIRKKPFPRKFYVRQLFKLECFIDNALSSSEIPFLAHRGADGRHAFDAAKLAEDYFRLIPDFIEVVNSLSPEYDYNEHITLFIACCGSVGLLGEDLHLGIFWTAPNAGPPRLLDVSAGELFNSLVEKIRTEWKAQGIQSKIRARRAKFRDKYTEYCRYTDSLFDDCARQIVLRVDLYYKAAVFDCIDIHGAIRDRNRLFDNSRRKSIFKSMNGYIAKVAYGVEKGIHIQCLFFLDASKRVGLSHECFARQVGEYWMKTIKNGQSDPWNSDDKITGFAKFGTHGIGVIHAQEMALRDSLQQHVIGLLCLSDQLLTPKSEADLTLIRRGSPPKKPPKKRGRPCKSLIAKRGVCTEDESRLPADQ